MAPKDNLRLPLRWQFVPFEEPRDRSVRWTWRAYTQSGDVALYTEKLFDTFAECVDDAKQNGYGV